MCLLPSVPILMLTIFFTHWMQIVARAGRGGKEGEPGWLPLRAALDVGTWGVSP